MMLFVCFVHFILKIALRVYFRAHTKFGLCYLLLECYELPCTMH